eukprot:4200219-Amphidinium_carterae.1
MFHDVHTQDARRQPFAARTAPGKGKDKGKGKGSQGVFEAEVEEPNEEDAAEEQPEEDEAEPGSGSEAESGDTEDLLETMYAASSRVKSKFKERRQGKSIEERKRTSKCADCGETGHWRGDPQCRKVRSGEVAARKPPTSGGGAQQQQPKKFAAPVFMVNSSSGSAPAARAKSAALGGGLVPGGWTHVNIPVEVGVQTDLSGPVRPDYSEVPSCIMGVSLEAYTNKQLQ